jgi:uncharacterized protein (TIGR02001 family)
MNKKIIALAAVALGAISVSAQEEATGPKLAGSLGVAYDSLYVFRGVQFAENILEPSVNLTYGDFYTGLWFALPMKNSNQYATEMDFTFGYGLAINDLIKLDMGATRYTYDDIPDRFFDGDSNTTEFYLGAVFDLPLSPALYVFRDIDAESATAEIRLSHTFELANGFGIGLAGAFGHTSIEKFSESNCYYYNASANLSYAVSEASSLSVGGRFGGSDKDQVYGALGNGMKNYVAWFGASFTTSF